MTQSSNLGICLDHRIDLLSCDQEPIHTPGAIQQQGVLLVARLDNFIITHVSENIADCLGVSPGAAFGRPLREVIGEVACQAIRGALAGKRHEPSVVLAVTAHMAPVPLQMVAHATNGSVLIEFEAAPNGRNHGLAIQRTQAIMHALHAASSQRELCDIVATKLRELTGYDRVMVYRFDREGSGEVIAEDCEPDLEPYLGLHYPASDIPPQARRMYLAQRVRGIADVDYIPVPLLADPALGQVWPVDMTRCALRSVSPAHLEYMRNMGTRASLGVSLIPGTSLWGMLVCHHRSPLAITADLRAQCDLIGQLVSLLLGSMGEMESYAEQLHRQRTLHDVVARMTESEHVADALLAGGDAFLSMLDASGAVIRLGERTVTLGLTPPMEAATRAMTALRTGSEEDLIAIDELQECIADWSTESATASGALYLNLPSGPGDAIIWFRPEIEREVKWAGDPKKAVDPDPATGRLSPRRSFALWKERVAGHSEPWQDADRATAREIGRTITTALARQSVAELAKLRHYDALTQLPNRRMLQEHLDALGAASDVALLFLDLDRFKAVNDTHGHAAGDSMLLQVAARLTKAVRSGDLVARVGGDEFVILCSKISVLAAEELAERIRLELALPFSIGGQPFLAGGSVGVAHTDTTETPKLLDAGDAAMYIDKRQRKNLTAALEARLPSAVVAPSTQKTKAVEATTLDKCRLAAGTDYAKKKRSGRRGGTPAEVQEQQRRHNARFWLAAIADSSDDAIIGKDLDGLITSWNRAAEVMFGYAADEIVGQSINLIIPPDRFDEETSIRARILNGEKVDHFETKRQSKSGAIIPISLTVSPVRDDRGKLIGGSKVARDCSERDSRERLLTRMASHDSLTELVNRRVFVKHLEMAIALARQGGEGFAVLYLDLDHFKDVNDTLGHPAGDLFLKTVAQRLLESVRDFDTVGRFGGDEFAILVIGIPEPEEVAKLTDRLLKAVGKPIRLEADEILPGASVGIAVYEQECQYDAEALLSHADLALYCAKSDGRGTFRFFTDSMDAEIRARIALDAELREAVALEQFFLMYQPQVEIETGRIVGAEALVRWRHPSRGLVGPATFIPAAERSGLIIPLARWVLKEACQQTKKWHDAGIELPSIAINVSGNQFKRPLELETDIVAALSESGLSASFVELELTESVLMETSREHNNILSRLRNMGLRIALDDFGSGYSSLGYLRRFQVERIKIDQTFVADIETTPGSAAIVRAALTLARELGIGVVVEGVESKGQLELLRAWGSRIIQGYYYARPLAEPEMTALLRVGHIIPSIVAEIAEDGPFASVDAY
jgi:diguanylate cyclase (GGDEF)-like protein/PAS domain S-box-containing protein